MSKERSYFKVQGQFVALDLFRERRNNVRAAVGKDSLLLRVPILMPKMIIEKHVQWAKDWITKQIDSNPKLLGRLSTPDYLNMDALSVGDREYLLSFEMETEGDALSARWDGTTIHFTVPADAHTSLVNRNIQKMIRRMVGKINKSKVSKRVHELNQQYFGKKINRVTLKYNTSNWGSCSINGNINLSTRLLFAPEDVQDYVIVHELAHLVEMNHSSKFWDIVREIMPDYKEKEEWLKKYNHLYTI